MANTSTDERRVYIACLACYNGGRLTGAWVDAAEAPDFDGSKLEHDADVCPHEEYAIHDHEGFEGISISESMRFADVARLAEMLDEADDAGAFAAWYENETRDLSEDLAEQFREVYQGTFRTVADYAEDYMEQTGGLSEMPANLRIYFDFESFARDMELGGDIWTAEGGDGVYVFTNS